jgi:thymidylate synthase
MTPLVRTYNDVNEAYHELQYTKKHYTKWEDTRNGAALVWQAPVLVCNASPYRRVLFDPIRNANPFFHYMEAIWMLAGSNDVYFLNRFSQQIKEYSDNGSTFHGAYGHRWRFHFGQDQLDSVIHQLKKSPSSRRIVLSMWDPKVDMESFSKDLPCNTHIYFRVVDRKLDMTVCNRSNDLAWGMMGANIVHMSILQEYIANAAEMEIGNLYQFTNNLHVYKGWEDKWREPWDHWYELNPMARSHKFSPTTLNLIEAERFLEDGIHTNYPYKCQILRDNAVPMFDAWLNYKSDNLPLAKHIASRIYDDDWKRACMEWLTRVEAKRDGSQDPDVSA